MRKVFSISLTILLAAFSLSWGQKQLTLQECIDTALKNNWDYKSAIWSNKTAGNNLWSAWGEFMPRVDFNFSNVYNDVHSNKTYTDPLGNVISGSGKGKSYSAGFSASQTLFDGGANVYNLSGSYAAKHSSDASLLYNKQSLIFSVKQSYFALLKAKMLSAVQEEVVKRGEQQLKIAQSRFELGSASKSDYLKAKVQFGQDQLAALKAENQVNVARANLNSIMGQSVDQPVDASEELTKPELPLPYDECVSLAYKNHPSIRQSESDLDFANASMRSARGSFLPTVRVNAGYGWRGAAIGDFKDMWGDDYSWNVGLTASFNIFEGFGTKTRYFNARNDMHIAKERIEQTKAQVALEVKQAFLAMEETKKSITVTEENQGSAEEDLNLVQEKYRLGAASILELLDAQVSFQTAKSDHVQALFDYNLAVARLERAIGR